MCLRNKEVLFDTCLYFNVRIFTSGGESPIPNVRRTIAVFFIRAMSRCIRTKEYLDLSKW